MDDLECLSCAQPLTSRESFHTLRPDLSISNRGESESR